MVRESMGRVVYGGENMVSTEKSTPFLPRPPLIRMVTPIYSTLYISVLPVWF